MSDTVILAAEKSDPPSFPREAANALLEAWNTRTKRRSRSNAKRKGTRNEHRSIRLLEAAGYACTRAAASLGVWDIIGIGSVDVLLVQVKTRDWPGTVEMEALTNFVCPPTCRKLVHRWRDGERTPDVREIR